MYYNLQFSDGTNISPNPEGYILQAVPNGPQEKDTRCLKLTLDHTGKKGIDTSATGTVAECW